MFAARAAHENPGEYAEVDARMRAGEYFPRVTVDFNNGALRIAAIAVAQAHGEEAISLGEILSAPTTLAS